MTFFDMFHTVTTSILKFKIFLTQSSLHLFDERKHSVKFYFSLYNMHGPLVNAAS